jgi:molybdopterin-guanine dinucleotide biosynthesis protein A
MTPPPAGLILAGGQSRRFGSDKAVHAVAGSPMVARVYAAVAGVADPVLISFRSRPTAPPPIPARVVLDCYAGAGPLAGLHAGLLAAPAPWLLTVACDLPFITQEALLLLLRHCTPGTRAAVAVDEEGHLQPLCECYHTSVLPLVEDHLRRGRYALYGLLDRLHPHLRTVPLAGGVLRNVNRPSDLEEG